MKEINIFQPNTQDFKNMLRIGGIQVYLNSQKLIGMITNADTYQYDEKRLSTDRMFSRGDIVFYDDDYYMVITQVGHRYESYNGQIRRLEQHIYFNMSFLNDAPQKYILKVPVVPQKTSEFNIETNNDWGLIQAVQRISLFIPQNELTQRIAEMENKTDGIIIFGRRPYQIIGVTNNDKGMFAINLELTTLNDSLYDKENNIYQPPINWREFENLSIYELEAEPTEPIPQVQTDVGFIQSYYRTFDWSDAIVVNWSKDVSSQLYQEFLIGYRVKIIGMQGEVIAETNIGSADTLTATLIVPPEGFGDNWYIVSIEAIYSREGMITYMKPQTDKFYYYQEALPVIQTNVGNLTISNNDHTLVIGYEKDKTYPDDERFFSHYLVKIYNADTETATLIDTINNGKNINLQWVNTTSVKPNYYLVTVQSVFNANDNESIMLPQYATTKPLQSTVTVYYKDVTGETVAPTQTITGFVGETYSTTQLTLEGYDFDSVTPNASGVFTEEPIEVTYTYTEQEVVYGSVTVKYLDADNVKLKNDVVITQPVGTPYTASQDAIEGYTFDRVVGDVTGIITVEPKEVTFYYNEVIVVQYGTVTVKYLDENSQPIKEQLVLTGEVGTTYNTTQETITSYDFVSVTGNTTGTYIDGNIDVIYNYQKQEVVEFQVIPPVFESLEAQYTAPQRTSSRVLLRGTDDIAQHPSLHDKLTGYSIQVFGLTSSGAERFISNLTVMGKLKDNIELVTAYFVMTSSEVGLKIRIRSQYDIDGTINVSDYTDAYLIYKNVWTTLFAQQGNVIVNYIDDGTSSTIETVTLTGNVGSTYTTEQKDFSSNDLVFDRVVGETTGTFTKEDIVVNYYYVWDGW